MFRAKWKNTVVVQWIRCECFLGEHLVLWTSVVFSHIALRRTPFAYFHRVALCDVTLMWHHISVVLDVRKQGLCTWDTCSVNACLPVTCHQSLPKLIWEVYKIITPKNTKPKWPVTEVDTKVLGRRHRPESRTDVGTASTTLAQHRPDAAPTSTRRWACCVNNKACHIVGGISSLKKVISPVYGLGPAGCNRQLCSAHGLSPPAGCPQNNPANTRHWAIAGSMLVHRLRRWPNIELTMNGVLVHLCAHIYRLNWTRRISWWWWDEWDDTALQTQDSKFKPWW